MRLTKHSNISIHTWIFSQYCYSIHICCWYFDFLLWFSSTPSTTIFISHWNWALTFNLFGKTTVVTFFPQRNIENCLDLHERDHMYTCDQLNWNRSNSWNLNENDKTIVGWMLKTTSKYTYVYLIDENFSIFCSFYVNDTVLLCYWLQSRLSTAFQWK